MRTRSESCRLLRLLVSPRSSNLGEDFRRRKHGYHEQVDLVMAEEAGRTGEGERRPANQQPRRSSSLSTVPKLSVLNSASFLLNNPQQRPLQPLPILTPSPLRISHHPTLTPPHRKAVACSISLDDNRSMRRATGAPGACLGGTRRSNQGATEGGEAGGEELCVRKLVGDRGGGGRTYASFGCGGWLGKRGSRVVRLRVGRERSEEVDR